MMSESCYVMPASFFSCDKDADDFFSLPFVFLSFCLFSAERLSENTNTINL